MKVNKQKSKTTGSAVKYLLSKEWSMGNGQCPECFGVPASWHGHSLYLTGADIGHERNCSLAKSLAELGKTPLMKGDYKNKIVYENYITDSGFHSTRLKTPDGCPRIRKLNSEFQRKILTEQK